MRVDNEYLATPHEIRCLKDAYKGDRLFVFGTGPSLMDMNQNLLGDLVLEQTFATNKLMSWKGLRFIPNFHGLSEAEDMPHLKEYISMGFSPMRFACHPEPINEDPWMWVPKCVDGSHEQNLVVYGMQGLGDTLGPLPTASSTPLTLGVQLGAWMGFDPIYLLGCDNTNRGQVFNENLSRPAPHPDHTAASAVRMKHDMMEAGRSLIDCTPNGKLGISYTPLEEVLNE